jgi:hypothetical protein
MRKFLRITIPIALIIVSLIYINSAFYSSWVSGGPPNNYPEAWAYRSFRHFFYGIGFVVFAITFFLATKPIAKNIVAKCIIGSAVALSLFATPHIDKFIDIDSCLDRGGRWSEVYHKCER